MAIVFKYYYGTPAGGKQAAATNRKLYGKNFYEKIGRRGGQSGTTGGFFANPSLARIAGSKGGKNSFRGFCAVKIDENGDRVYRRRVDGALFVKHGDDRYLTPLEEK